jgi:uncharacterized SAM-binding protein YcdF (DUF218 family)
MGILVITVVIISVFSILYFIYLNIFGGGGGFEVFWLLLSITCFLITLIIRNHHIVRQYVPKLIRYTVVLLIIILITSFIIIETSIIKDSIKKDDYTSTDYIVVLGASVRGTKLSLTLYNRLNVALDYLEEHENSKAILSGGQGPGEDITEAEAMKRYLIENGIDEKRLIMEDKSTSTRENIKNSFEIINGFTTNASVTVITSDFHVYRAKKIASLNGIKVQGIPSKTFPPLIINYYFREYFAVIKDIII